MVDIKLTTLSRQTRKSTHVLRQTIWKLLFIIFNERILRKLVGYYYIFRYAFLRHVRDVIPPRDPYLTSENFIYAVYLKPLSHSIWQKRVSINILYDLKTTCFGKIRTKTRQNQKKSQRKSMTDLCQGSHTGSLESIFIILMHYN